MRNLTKIVFEAVRHRPKVNPSSVQGSISRAKDTSVDRPNIKLDTPQKRRRNDQKVTSIGKRMSKEGEVGKLKGGSANRLKAKKDVYLSHGEESSYQDKTERKRQGQHVSDSTIPTLRKIQGSVVTNPKYKS